MGAVAIGLLALAGFLEEGIITGGLPELYATMGGLFLGCTLLLIAVGWMISDARALGAALAPLLGALAYVGTQGHAFSPTTLEPIPFYLALTLIGVLLGRLVPRHQGGSRVGGLR